MKLALQHEILAKVIVARLIWSVLIIKTVRVIAVRLIWSEDDAVNRHDTMPIIYIRAVFLYFGGDDAGGCCYGTLWNHHRPSLIRGYKE